MYQYNTTFSSTLLKTRKGKTRKHGVISKSFEAPAASLASRRLPWSSVTLFHPDGCRREVRWCWECARVRPLNRAFAQHQASMTFWLKMLFWSINYQKYLNITQYIYHQIGLGNDVNGNPTSSHWTVAVWPALLLSFACIWHSMNEGPRRRQW